MRLNNIDKTLSTTHKNWQSHIIVTAFNLLAVFTVAVLGADSFAKAQTPLQYTEVGTINGGVVADSWADLSTETTFVSGNFIIRVPTGSTIQRAYIASAVQTQCFLYTIDAGVPQGPLPRQAIIGSGVSAQTITLQGFPGAVVEGSWQAGDGYSTFLADVTGAVRALLPLQAVDGTITVPIQERGDGPTAPANCGPHILGHTLVVLYSNSQAPFRNYFIAMGAAGTNVNNGSNALTVNLASPIAKACNNEEPYPASVTLLYNSSVPSAATFDQAGIIRFNGQNVSSNAGGADDDVSGFGSQPVPSALNTLITGGSFGAQNGSLTMYTGRPVEITKGDQFDGTGSNSRLDDELYNLRALAAVADKSQQLQFVYIDNPNSGIAGGGSVSYISTLVGQTLARVTNEDADGDTLTDAAEGCGDDDGDGLPNYVDNTVLPNATDDRVRIVAGASASIPFATLTANDSEPDGNTLTITAVANQSAGLTAAINGTNIDVTVPANGTTATFTYTVSNGIGGVDNATVTIDLLTLSVTMPTNNATLTTSQPVFAGTTLSNQQVTVLVQQGVNTIASLNTSSGNGNAWSVSSGGLLVDGMYTATASVSDSFGNSATQNVAFTIATTNSGDGDGIPDALDADDDNDGIPDSEEGATRDSDGDSVPNRLDLDSDNDAIPDVVEAGFAAFDADHNGRVDIQTGGDGDADGWDDRIDDSTTGVWNGTTTSTDADTRPDYLDLDSDADGITDATEAGFGAQDVGKDGRVDNLNVVGMDTDADDNGWLDAAIALGNPVNLPNSDTPTGGVADATPDYIDLDSDGDNVPDATEGHDANRNGQPDVNAVGADSDGDGLDNAFDPIDTINMLVGTPAALQDTDNDGTVDYRDRDDDGDSVFTRFEDAARNGTGDPRALNTDADAFPNYLDADDDGDGSSTVSEMADPNMDGDPADAVNTSTQDNPDVPDYLDAGTTPVDTDGDGLSDSLENMLGTNPGDADSDNDGVCDGSRTVQGICVLGEDAQMRRDTDGDGTLDALEPDDDNDGLPTRSEDVNGNSNALDDDTDSDGIPNFRDADDDGDGILTRDEIEDGKKDGTDDPDRDGTPNWLDTDSDGDGLTDLVEGRINDRDNDGSPDYLDSATGGPAGGSLGCSVREPNGTGAGKLWLYIMAALCATRMRRSRKSRAA